MSVIPLTERCSTCKGQAKVLSLGNLYKLCENCGGTGYIHHKSVSAPPELTDEETAKFRAHRKRMKSPTKKDMEKSTVDNVSSSRAAIDS